MPGTSHQNLTPQTRLTVISNFIYGEVVMDVMDNFVVADVKHGEMYLNKYVNKRNCVCQINSIDLVDCVTRNDIGEEVPIKVQCLDPEAIDILTRMMACDIFHADTSWEDGYNLLQDWIEIRFGDKAHVADWNEEIISV